MYSKNQYSEKQYNVVKRSRKDSRRYGKIDDVNPAFNSSEVMNIVALGRGPNPEYGKVDDCIDRVQDYNLLGFISKGRGDNPTYGNIDTMVSGLMALKLSYKELEEVSKRRGNKLLAEEYARARTLALCEALDF